MKAKICDICGCQISEKVRRCKVIIYDYDAWSDTEYSNKLDLCPSCTNKIIKTTKEQIIINRKE